MPISARRRAWDNTHAYAYGYGFRMADVDGAWTVSHTGTLSGMYSVMTLLPDKRSGFVVLMNGDGDEARTVLNEVLVKHFTAPGQGRHRERIRRTHRRRTRIVKQQGTPGHIVARGCHGDGACPDDSASGAIPGSETRRCACTKTSVRFTSAKSPELQGQVVRVGQRYLIDWDGDDLDGMA